MFERLVTVATLCLPLWYSARPPEPKIPEALLSVPQLVLASFYDEPQLISSGAQYDPFGLTAAHRTLPIGTRVEVTDAATGKSVTVTINDRGPALWTGRGIDLSLGAAQALQMEERGVILATLKPALPAQ
jgi:rare lipoprotein A (peptidoglycan hydrolase)